jgi:hypothetical protein
MKETILSKVTNTTAQLRSEVIHEESNNDARLFNQDRTILENNVYDRIERLATHRCKDVKQTVPFGRTIKLPGWGSPCM